MVRKLVFVILLGWKVGAQFLSAKPDGVAHGLYGFARAEAAFHHLHRIVPKSLAHNVVYALVAYYGELPVLCGEKEEDAVAQLCLCHATRTRSRRA